MKPVGAKMPESQKTSDQQLVQAYRILRSINKTLIMGDHDYGGHRAKAVRDVGKAEKQLQKALEFQGKKAPGGKAVMPAWHPEPQKFSNAELASKIPVLHRTIALLEKADHDYGGHRVQAVADLRVAVMQLEIALKYAKSYDQKKL